MSFRPNFPYADAAALVLLRNSGMVPAKNLAAAMECTEGEILSAQKALGIYSEEADPSLWLKKGYITVIRNNYTLLPDEQIVKLLGWTAERYARALKEEDFLGEKLGAKPACAPVRLQEADRSLWPQIKAAAASFFVGEPARPFDFYRGKRSAAPPVPAGRKKIAYAYSASYDSDGAFSEQMLKDLKASNVNGIWIPAVLYEVTPFPFDPSLSAGWEERLCKIKQMIGLAAKFGIKIYLYLNEPRCMREEFFVRWPQLKGAGENGFFALCTSDGRVKRYLTDAVAFLTEKLEGLGGIIAIAMSENLTNCYSREPSGRTRCPRCQERDRAQVIAEIYNLMHDGIRKSGSDAELICWNWGWNGMYHWNEEESARILRSLHPEITLMCVSEDEQEFVRGGLPQKVYDYSISVSGPSEKSLRLWRAAKEQGRKIMAKVQINNSWECAFVPYLPVYKTVIRHIRRLKEAGIDDFMLCWTLGGYPTGALALTEYDYSLSDEEILADFSLREFGTDDGRLLQAFSLFSEAFSCFPFSMNSLYYGPQNQNEANLLYEKSSGMHATMVCYPFDDAEKWRYPYGEKAFADLYARLSEKWNEGAELLKNMSGRGEKLEELITVSEACGIAFASAHRQFLFCLNREGKDPGINDLLRAERRDAKRMYELQRRFPAIGFESSNHYFFWSNNLFEKYLNCLWLEKIFQ